MHYCLHSVVFAVGFILFGALLVGCVAFEPTLQSTVEDLSERPVVALLPVEFELPITKLSYVKTVDDTLTPEEEALQLTYALDEIRQEARWLFVSRLATSQGFRFVPLQESDALAEELGLKAGVLTTIEQVKAFQRRLGADVVIDVHILDYEKNSVAVVGRRHVRRHLSGDRCHWSSECLESRHHLGKCGVGTPHEHASLVRWGLCFRRRDASRASGGAGIRNQSGMAVLAGDGRVCLCSGRTEDVSRDAQDEEGIATPTQPCRDHGILR